MRLWGEEYKLFPEESRVIHAEQGTAPEGYLDIFLVHYLLKPVESPLTNQWISEKELPGGATFFRGPHAIPTHLITEKYGEDLAGFEKACEDLHGEKLDMGDAAYVFTITPRLKITVILWRGDEEFPAESKMIFDSGMKNDLALDVVFALAVSMCMKIAKREESVL